VFATALFNAMTVDAPDDLDVSDTPALGAPWSVRAADRR
jgi:hypothetical protein